ncbi:MAG TPA: TadE family protein [Candidatus Limnocylindrales bacterium]|nr:TadE family protein [Candidatus Limnocylindrales bacterium]
MTSPARASRASVPGGGAKAREGGQSVVEFALILPLMVIIMFAIVDFARIYTAMMSVESAAREAADYGTTLGAGRWQVGPVMDGTVDEMRRRACVASSDLPDYAEPSGTLNHATCTNPTFSYCVTASPGGSCGPVNAADLCDDPLRSEPCTVTVTLGYDFHLINPFHLDFFGVQLGVPAQIAFQRDSTFAITDIDLSTGP